MFTSCVFGLLILFSNNVYGMNDTHRESLKLRTESMFDFAFTAYLKYGFPHDEVDPLYCKGRSRDNDPNNWGLNDVLGGYALTLIDSLDTLAVMGKKKTFEKSVKLVIEKVHFNLDVRVQVFEVTIRILGGLLSAHLFAINPDFGMKISWYQGELLDLAIDLADRLLPAFSTPFGLPYPRVNLMTGVLPYEVEEACTAGAGTLVLEFGVLSRLTGNPVYEEAAKKALFEVWDRRSHMGLVGNTMKLFDKSWADELSGIGAGSDSFYEYLFKAHILLGGTDYLEKYQQSYAAIIEWVMDTHGFVYKNVNMHNAQLQTPWIDSLAAFFPGLQVLSGDVERAIRPHLLYFTIWEKYGALPERFNFQTQDTPIESYPLRPELIESTYLLYQATGNSYYLTVGETILGDLEKYTKARCGYVGLADVRTKRRGDRMESFFLSETLKYLYLLFDKENTVNRMDTNSVFTTEGHLMLLPHNYTTLAGSSSKFQTCPKFTNPPFIFGAPLDAVWTDRCREFIGSNVNRTTSHSKDLESLVSDYLNVVNVILPWLPGTGRDNGEQIMFKNFIILDNIRGLPIGVRKVGESYKACFFNLIQLDNNIALRIRGEGAVDRALINPFETNSVFTARLQGDEIALLMDPIECFGPSLVQGKLLFDSFIDLRGLPVEQMPKLGLSGKVAFLDECEAQKAFILQFLGVKAIVLSSSQHVYLCEKDNSLPDVDPITIPSFVLRKPISSDQLSSLLHSDSVVEITVIFTDLLQAQEQEITRITYLNYVISNVDIIFYKHEWPIRKSMHKFWNTIRPSSIYPNPLIQNQCLLYQCYK